MKPRVLVVEDNAANLYLTTFLLTQAGAEVLSANDGASAVDLARSTQPALIVLDLSLPVLDGYSAAAALRGDPTTAHIPLIAVTAYAQSAEKERALAAGFVDYFDKPIDTAVFASAVLRHITVCP